MTRVVVKKGDLFKVELNNGFKVFQFLVEDRSCLDGDVIKVFEYSFSRNEEVTPEVLLNSEVLFYAHTSASAGVKLGVWNKIKGIKIPYDENEIPIFRSTIDGFVQVKISEKWYVWEVNQERKFLGKLTDDYRKCPVGSLYHPFDIKDWIETGNNGFSFPS